MLKADPKDLNDPGQRVYAALWNESHSINAVLDGWRVAILLDPINRQPPPEIEKRDGAIVLWWVSAGPKGALRYNRLRTSASEFLRVVEQGLVSGRVLLARPDAGPIADKALLALGYRREILGQVAGYWFGPGRDIPAEEPSYNATGALIPRLKSTLVRGVQALGLVPIDGEWRILSTEAIHTYSFTSGLASGEKWVFVPRPLSLEPFPWPHRLRIELSDPIRGSDVAAGYGDAAGARATASAGYVQFKIVEVQRRGD